MHLSYTVVVVDDWPQHRPAVAAGALVAAVACVPGELAIVNAHVVANAWVAGVVAAAVVWVFGEDEVIFVDCVSGALVAGDAAVVVAVAIAAASFADDGAFVVGAAVGQHFVNVADVATKSVHVVAAHDRVDEDSAECDCAYVAAAAAVVAAVALSATVAVDDVAADTDL